MNNTDHKSVAWGQFELLFDSNDQYDNFIRQ